MDTQNFSNDFQAGEFAQPSLLSPVAVIETATNGKLSKNDALLNKAVASFFALELANTDSMTINSYFHGWGLGKTDLSQYSDYYQSHVIDEPLGQAQCWICPHCHDDAYHQSDENGCEWQYKQDADYTIDLTCNPPAGFKQVCTVCGHDRFMLGVTYSKCPTCELNVVHYCRYERVA